MRIVSWIGIGSIILCSACHSGEQTSDAFGNFESEEVLVSAESQGRLIDVSISEGDRLQRGKITAIIDTTGLHLKKRQLAVTMQSLHTKMQTLRSQIETKKIEKENLDRELARVKRLLKDGAATIRQRDDLQGKVRVAQAGIRSMESQMSTLYAERESVGVQIQQVNNQLDHALVKNPVEGVVLQKYKKEGEVVAPGQALYKIANLDQLILRAYVSGNQLSEVKIGAEATVLYDTPDGLKEIPGTISWVASEAEFTPKIIQTREERVNLVYAIKVRVENDGSLKIGMPGETRF